MKNSNMKRRTFLKVTTVAGGGLLVGCSFGAIQKAGGDALAEAICLYEKKVEYNSDDFSKCLDSHTRQVLFDPVSY